MAGLVSDMGSPLDMFEAGILRAKAERALDLDQVSELSLLDEVTVERGVDRSIEHRIEQLQQDGGDRDE